MFSKKNISKIDWPLVVIPVLAVLGLSFILIKLPTASQNLLQSWRSFLCGKLTPYYLIIGLLFLLSTLFFGFSKYGKIKLGEQGSKPEYPR